MEQFHYLLMQVSNLSNRLIHRQTGQLGLDPGQPKILQALYTGGSMTPGKIGLMVVLDKSSTTLLLNRMEKKGLVTKRKSPEDGRSQIIELTKSGKKLAEKVMEIGDHTDEIALKDLSEEEKQDLIRLLNRVKENFEHEI